MYIQRKDHASIQLSLQTNVCCYSKKNCVPMYGQRTGHTNRRGGSKKKDNDNFPCFGVCLE